VVNGSTVSPGSNTELCQKLSQRGFRFLESPCTGSGINAKAGTLVFIAGGDKSDFELMEPLYKAMGSASYFAGEVGAASYAKIASNLMLAVNMAAFAEAYAIVTKAGVDLETFVKFTQGGGSQSAAADKKLPKLQNRDFSPAFRLALLHKDTWLAANAARELRTQSPMLNLAKELYGISVAEGYGDEDACAIVKCYERWASINLA
jgi:3-hydroxyisobutyrate dehydrogenase-like beta-hydroxyacid dehydrogenase